MEKTKKLAWGQRQQELKVEALAQLEEAQQALANTRKQVDEGASELQKKDQEIAARINFCS